MAKKNPTTTVVTTTSSVKEFYSRQEVVRAICWATGLSKKTAEIVYNETCVPFHNITAHDYHVYGERRSVRG